MTHRGRASERLIAIAAAIGCSVETFYLPESEASAADTTDELLSLWSRITEPQARQRILAGMRHEAGVTPVLVKAAE